MSLPILLTLISTIVVAAFFFGREAYRRSMRVRQRLQMGQIFTNITHELLTPLTVISASVDHLRDEAPEHIHDYDMMQLNIQRMVRLLQQILETSKSQVGELKLKVSNGDVMRYIHDTALCLKPLMTQKGLKFTIQCYPQSMMGWIDTDKLDKVIYNLLSNAAKYTSQGEVLLEAKTSKNYDYLYIKVSDTGNGIPKDKMKHLYERFYDGEYRRHKTIGTGIGLALTRDLVYLNHGTIDCESKEGQGTTFTIRIPITKEAFKPEQIDEEHKLDFNIPKNAVIDFNTTVPDFNKPSDDGSSDDEDTYKILVVEDNLELLMLMQHVLKSHYRVFVAKNGKEALDIVYKTDLDLIVSDVMMPEMDGMELTETLKGDADYKHLPIILLTAKTQEDDEQEALKLGADEYLTKPFRLGDLKLRIDNIIENRKRAQQEYTMKAGESGITKPNKPQTPEELFIQKAKDCVLSHLEDYDYDRDAFASDMGASASTLYNKLRATTGMNVSTFIRDIRMKEARKMAENNPGIRVSDLAYKVGFQDPKYFSTCFKKQFGILPKEFLEGLIEKK